MNVCRKCGNVIPNWVEIDGIKRNLKSRKFCLECSSFGTHNTKPILSIGLKDYGNCLYCGKPLNAYGRKYCNQSCKNEHKYSLYIEKWKKHEITGRNSGSYGQTQISGFIRRYIFEKYNYKCSKCGWSKINPYTHTIPLEIDHIDGNCENSCEENLILVCPNCHSLTETYRGANRGHGRNITWVPRENNQY